MTEKQGLIERLREQVPTGFVQLNDDWAYDVKRMYNGQLVQVGHGGTSEPILKPANRDGHEAADALERLRGYARHELECPTAMLAGIDIHNAGELCTCGLDALLKELDQ